MVIVAVQLVAGLLLLASASLLLKARWRRHQEQVEARVFNRAGIRQAEARLIRRGHLNPLLRRAGYRLNGRLLLGLLLAFLLGAVPLSWWLGLPGLLFWIVCWPVLLYAALLIKARRRAARMTAQFPTFLDQVVRGVRTGASLHGAMLTAIANTREPLAEVLSPAERALRMGASLHEVFHDAADRYELEAFRALAAGIEINTRYGGSPVTLLESIARMIRERDRWARELRAMTGETRFSALVLALMPVGLAAYMFASNPEYLMHMWEHETGQLVLIGSVAWQALGCFLLWRMVKTV
ncbi:type II secretion system F family protein [Methylonatrum kenyense]|uniref:type II secretion system F family protein n=1 Tax=Methylonatrum kenyense TaxID=455253 RepID=UPI0020C0573D|nr:type II secretion system F family protein [Methylonatrum kenyense]MCK8515210.1 type II secretion system F family protein [Methylonatrum kenyense]